MRKLLNLSKTLLVAAALCVGASNAWASVTWDFTNSTTWGSVTLPSAGNSYADVSYDATGAVATTGNFITFHSSTGQIVHPSSATNGIGFSSTGSTSDHYAKISVPAGSTVTVTAYVSSNRNLQVSFNGNTETFSANWAEVSKDFVNSTASAIDLYMYCSANAGGTSNAPYLRKVVLKQTVAVTINYRDKDDLENTIISSTVVNVETGTSYTPTYTSPLYVSDNDPYEYTYYSGATERTITEATSIDILYSKADRAQYSYTVKAIKASDSSLLEELASGTAYKGASVTYYWYAGIDINGTLYTASAVNSQYKTSFTLDTDSKVVNVSYTASNNNLLFYGEGEDFFTAATGSNADIRCSMGKGGYASTKTGFVTLPAGSYTLVASNRCSGEKTDIHKFYKGDDSDPFFSANGFGYNNSSETTFTLTDLTTIYMQGGSSADLVDYIYVYGTPTNTVVGTADFATDYLGDMSSLVTLSPGESYHYQFVNHNNNGANAQNWVLPVYASDGTTKKIVLRNDSWDDIAWNNEGCTSNYIWETFVSDMNGAMVDMTVSYSADNVLTMSSTITTTSSTEYIYSYTSAGNGISLSGDINIALSVSKSWLEIISEGNIVSKTITDAGWATYYSPYALNLASATGLTDAYIVTGGNAGVLAMTSVKNTTVPANTGLLLKGSAGTVTIPVVASSSTDVTTNKLVGVTAETSIDPETGWVLMATPKLGFYKNKAAFTVGANTAYLPVGFDTTGGGEARSFFALFDEEANGINTVNSEEIKANSFFDLQGRRVTMPTKGLYIVNGKKVIK